ncbi:MAG: hypothetical protein WCB04_15165 [Mycobacteriales bacterium]
MRRRLSSTGLAIALAALIAAGLALVGQPAQAASTTMLGGWSKNWKWYDPNIGPVQIYRGYDAGFNFATWGLTDAAMAHPTAPAYDYSFNLPPGEVALGLHDAELNTFIASTPTNIILTNYHEPEQEIEAGMFTFQQYRDAITRLATLVHAQNALDGGTRRVSVMLMRTTFIGFKGRNAENYWPTVNGVNSADLLSVDTYSQPHATGTAGYPIGYTDGVNWLSPTTMLGPTIKFAAAHNTPWGVSEFGFLEDTHNPKRKGDAITAFVAYAKLKGAVMCEYWDSVGGRADWELRWSNPPIPSQSNTSYAAKQWIAAVNAP